MNNVMIIMKKQRKDTLKNIAVLIQFIMFPLLGIIMTNAMKNANMPKNFFADLFAVMYIGMAPLTSVLAIISEEKEKNTLRVLMMADVTPAQYLSGIGLYVFLACMLGEIVFCCLLEGVTGMNRVFFLCIAAVGILASMLLGAAIGIGSRNQIEATSIGMPVMMIFSFLPMLSMFNDKIAKLAKITYSEQIRFLISNLENSGSCASHVAVIIMNMVLFGAIFFRKCRIVFTK